MDDVDKLKELFEPHWKSRECEKMGKAAAFEIYQEGVKEGIRMAGKIVKSERAKKKGIENGTPGAE